MTQLPGDENGTQKKRVHPFLLAFLLLAGTVVAVLISALLPASAVLALAAGTMALVAGIGLWRLWTK